jgi:hypothetical protein
VVAIKETIMTLLYFVLYLLAVVSFALAALRVPARVEFLGLGLLLFTLVPLIQAGQSL